MNITISSPFKKGKVTIYSSLWFARAKALRKFAIGFFAGAAILLVVFLKSYSLSAEILQPSPTPALAPKKNLVVENFELIIEKIGLEARVIPKVDPNNKENYAAALKKGLAHNKASSLPGQGRPIYIFGHSTNYAWFVEKLNALFFKLPEVEKGDEIKVNFNGQDFLYRVFEVKKVEAGEVSFLKEFEGQEVLILQTCWPAGTTWKRLLVLAEPREN